jgi:hypothetical protein
MPLIQKVLNNIDNRKVEINVNDSFRSFGGGVGGDDVK